MSKILGSWSGMRKYLENEMLAECLKGRVRYGCTAYVGMDGCHIFEIIIDGEQIKRFSWETVNTYFINNGYKENSDPVGTEEYWREFWTVLDAVPLHSRTEYTDDEFCDALKQYRNQDIRESVVSENALVLMFALLSEYDIHDIIWGRCDYARQYYRDKYLVTGHTPTYNINEDYRGKIYRQNNHIVIDCGAIFGGTLGCICLDTLEEFYVK